MKYLRNTAWVVTAVTILAVISCMLPACRRQSVYTATYLDAFDTVTIISVPASDTASAQKHALAIHDLLLDIHRDLDIYHHYEDRTNLYDLNVAAGGEALAVSETVLDVLALGKLYYEKTDGRLNICLGAVLRLWHDARADGTRLPDAQAVSAALENRISIDALWLDRSTGMAKITQAGVSVDVGAIAKGYALSRVQAYAEQCGLTDLLVNLGGQVLAIGAHPDGQPWTVQVRDPMDEKAPPRLIHAADMSVVTSGDYERTFTVDGTAYHHIIDPETGYPADRYHAVTVTVPHSHTKEADALSTALFLMDIEAGEKLLASIPGATAIWTETDGTVTESRNTPTT